MAAPQKDVSLHNNVHVEGNGAVGHLTEGQFVLLLFLMESCRCRENELACFEYLQVRRAPHQLLVWVLLVVLEWGQVVSGRPLGKL